MRPTSDDIIPASGGAGDDIAPYEEQRQGEHEIPETQAEAEEQGGPAEVWKLWDEQIKGALVGERRWRQEGTEAEELYFGEDKDPGGTPSANSTGHNRITDKQALIHGNVDVLKPILYSETPAPIVRRRFRGDGKTDETDLMSAEVGQRLAQYIIDTEDFDGCMENVRDDWLIAGRGAARAYYSASFMADAMGQEVKADERVYAGYVDWKRLVIPPCASWAKAPWIAIENDLTRKAVQDRFGPEIADQMSFTHQGYVMSTEARRDLDNDTTDALRPDNETTARAESPFDTAKIFEIWVRETGNVIWWSPEYKDGLLDEIPDPLQLQKFWPMPKPLLATTKGESLNPRPDIKYYERRANEIDLASKKLKSILDVVSVSGAIPGTMSDQIKNLLNGENTIIPVQDWIALMEKGGMNNIIQWLPLEAMIAAINALVLLREQAKQAMFEASGVSDIMRAQGDPDETATAQNLKGRYAGMRVKGKQRQIAYYARDLLRILVEIALEQFDTKTLAEITGLDLPLTEADRAMMQMQNDLMTAQYQQAMQQFEALAQAAAMMEQQGIPVPQKPQPPQEPKLERVPGTSYEAIHERLRNDYLRKITLTIETDSTVLADEQEDKEARIEFLSAFTSMVTELMPLVGSGQFDLKTIKELLLFGLRGFPKSRTLESLIAELPEEVQQQEPPEEASVTVAKIKAEVDTMLEEMRQQNNEADRQHDAKMKGVDTITKAAEIAANPPPPPKAPQGANA